MKKLLIAAGAASVIALAGAAAYAAPKDKGEGARNEASENRGGDKENGKANKPDKHEKAKGLGKEKDGDHGRGHDDDYDVDRDDDDDRWEDDHGRGGDHDNNSDCGLGERADGETGARDPWAERSEDCPAMDKDKDHDREYRGEGDDRDWREDEERVERSEEKSKRPWWKFWASDDE